MAAAYEGTLAVPKANEWTKKVIKQSKLVMFIFGGNLLLTIGLLYFITDQGMIREELMWAMIIADTVLMGLVIWSTKKRGDRLAAVVDKIQGREVVFHKDHVEFGATLFSTPNPKPALLSADPYLKIQFRDIQWVKLMAPANREPAAIIIALMNDKKIVLHRPAFQDAETEFLNALASHKVSVPTLA